MNRAKVVDKRFWARWRTAGAVDWPNYPAYEITIDSVKSDNCSVLAFTPLPCTLRLRQVRSRGPSDLGSCVFRLNEMVYNYKGEYRVDVVLADLSAAVEEHDGPVVEAEGVGTRVGR